MDTHSLYAKDIKPGDYFGGLPVFDVSVDSFAYKVTLFLSKNKSNFVTLGQNVRVNVQREEKLPVEFTKEEVGFLLSVLGNAATTGYGNYPDSLKKVSAVRDSVMSKIEATGVSYSQAKSWFFVNDYFTVSKPNPVEDEA